MNPSNLKNLKDNLYILNDAIYRIKILIKMHTCIAENACGEKIKFHNFWGFLQRNLIYGAVITELFSISTGQAIEVMKQILKRAKYKEYDEFDNKILDWKTQICSHKDFRNKYLAHKCNFDPNRHEMNYQPIIKLVDNISEELDKIYEYFLKPLVPSHGGIIITPTTWPAENKGIIGDLREILALEAKETEN